MKIKRITNKKSFLIVITVVVLLVGAGIAAYVYTQQKATQGTVDERKRVNTINLDPPTEEQKDAGLEAKKQTVENEGENPQPSETFSVTFTSVSKNGDILQVRSLITKLAGSGTCELQMTRNTEVITKTAGIQAMANSSTCQGFNIPLSELSSGAWKMTLTVTINGVKEQATKEVEI